MFQNPSCVNLSRMKLQAAKERPCLIMKDVEQSFAHKMQTGRISIWLDAMGWFWTKQTKDGVWLSEGLSCLPRSQPRFVTIAMLPKINLFKVTLRCWWHWQQADIDIDRFRRSLLQSHKVHGVPNLHPCWWPESNLTIWAYWPSLVLSRREVVRPSLSEEVPWTLHWEVSRVAAWSFAWRPLTGPRWGVGPSIIVIQETLSLST